MTHTHRRCCSRNRLLALMALAGVLSLVGLDVIYVLHYSAEARCTAEETGDPYDCFICTNLFTIGIEFPIVGVLPEPEPVGEMPPPESVTAAPTEAVRLAGARSPPTVLV